MTNFGVYYVSAANYHVCKFDSAVANIKLSSPYAAGILNKLKVVYFGFGLCFQVTDVF